MAEDVGLERLLLEKDLPRSIGAESATLSCEADLLRPVAGLEGAGGAERLEKEEDRDIDVDGLWRRFSTSLLGL